MGNSFAKWFMKFAKENFDGEVPRPFSADIVCVGKDQLGSVKVFFRRFGVTSRKFLFLATDGPASRRKSSTRRNSRQTWEASLPNIEEQAEMTITERSKTTDHAMIVYSHQFVMGDHAYKIGEFYWSWARSPSYTPGLTYYVESCDPDVLFVTLGFREKKCVCFVDGTCYDIAALRRHVCELMGGGDVCRRVDDFRALATFAQCDFADGCGRSPEELIAAYKTVTKDRQDFLVDGDNWNVGLLKEFFNELAKSEKDAADFTVDDCKQYFQGLKWLLQLYNGFCPAWDFCPQQKRPNFAELAASMDQLDQTDDFQSDIDMILEVPVTVFKINQAMPRDAPEWVRNSGVFENFATLPELVEKYKTHLRVQLIREYPDIEKLHHRLPWVYRKGERSTVKFSGQRPDFASLFATTPRIRSTVIYQERGIGRVTEVNFEQSHVELYHFNLDRVQEGVVTATLLGSVWCANRELTWAGGGTPMRKVDFDKVIDGEPYICLGSKHFGVVGVRCGDGLLVSPNQRLNPPEGDNVIPFSELESVAHFKQFPKEHLRHFIE